MSIDVTKQPVSNDQETFPWSIDNKYYTADVEFRIFDLGEPPSRAIVGRITDKNAVSENTPVDEEDDLPTDDDQADVFRWQDCPALVYVLPSPADSVSLSLSFATRFSLFPPPGGSISQIKSYFHSHTHPVSRPHL